MGAIEKETSNGCQPASLCFHPRFDSPPYISKVKMQMYLFIKVKTKSNAFVNCLRYRHGDKCVLLNGTPSNCGVALMDIIIDIDVDVYVYTVYSICIHIYCRSIDIYQDTDL